MNEKVLPPLSGGFEKALPPTPALRKYLEPVRFVLCLVVLFCFMLCCIYPYFILFNPPLSLSFPTRWTKNQPMLLKLERKLLLFTKIFVSTWPPQRSIV